MESRLKQLGRKIREERLSRDISQEMLASMAGIDRSHMGHIERGRKDLRVSTLIKIAEALNVLPGELLDFQ